MPDRFHNFPKLLADAYRAQDYPRTVELASEYLELAKQHEEDWNYGNAIHQANIFLGLVALQKDDLAKAGKCLLAAGKTPGSPQLKTFGPNMLLAKKLLERGEMETVLAYLDQCKKFWYPVLRLFKIRKWKKTIKRGQISDFGANLIYLIEAADEERA